MSAGQHSIQLVAFNSAGESPPSTPPLSVNLAATSVSSGTSGVSSGTSGAGADNSSSSGTSDSSTPMATADGVTLRAETIATGLNDVTDVALASDAWILVAERAGRIRVYRDGTLHTDPAATLAETLTARGELLAVAVDPQFAANRWVYVAHTAAARPESERPLEFRISRLQETGGALVNQVTLLAGIPASSDRAAAALRFGPDGKLYAAFDDGGNERAQGDLASFNGKVMRLNPDGTTPADQAGATPVLATDFRSPRGLSWSPDGGVLWVCDARADGSERLTPVAVTGTRPMRARSRAPFGLPAPFGIGGAAVYPTSGARQFEGNLFVGAEAGRYLLRVRIDPADPLTVISTERLLEDRVGGIRAVTVGANGAIYFSTSDTLTRIVPSLSVGPRGRQSGLTIVSRD